MRGGRSRFLLIYCERCNAKLFKYQKDGPGPLKRLYLDRITPEKSFTKNLICSECKSVLGIGYIYPKEKRHAFRLFVGSIVKEVDK